MEAPVIQAQYQTLQEISGRFAKQSEQTTSMISQLQDHLRALQDGGWVGRGADGFFQEMGNEVLPATRRLADALSESQAVTLQIIQVLREAEDEAAQPFRMEGGEKQKGQNVVPPPDNVHSDDDGGILGWIGGAVGTAWNFIEDHRDQIALGGAILAAGIAGAAVTIATGGTAAPLVVGGMAGLTGAVVGTGVAGETTMLINGISAKYPLLDGVLNNMKAGAILGFGAGAIGSGLAGAGVVKTLVGGGINSAINFGGQMINQMIFQHRGLLDAGVHVDYGNVGGAYVKGMIGAGLFSGPLSQAGGILKVGLGKVLPLAVLKGAEGGQVEALLKSGLRPQNAGQYGYMSPNKILYDATKSAGESVITWNVAHGILNTPGAIRLTPKLYKLYLTSLGL